MATKKTASAKSSSSSSKKNAKAAKKKRAASPARRKSAGARASTKRKSAAGDKEVTIDRRRADRRTESSDAEQQPAQPPIERRKKVQRRRQIDPTTCERDYSDAEVEFMNAMDEYKRKSGRMFPTCSEVLEVIRDLGYVQLSPAGRAMLEQSELAGGDLTASDELNHESSPEGEIEEDAGELAADPTDQPEPSELAAPALVH